MLLRKKLLTAILERERELVGDYKGKATRKKVENQNDARYRQSITQHSSVALPKNKQSPRRKTF